MAKPIPFQFTHLPADMVKEEVAMYEPSYNLKTVMKKDTEMVEISEIENLLEPDKFKKVMSKLATFKNIISYGG